MSHPFDATLNDFVRAYTKDFEDQFHIIGLSITPCPPKPARS
jgi:hypothetical protein